MHAHATAGNPLLTLMELGQSVWYDYIRRDLFAGPELRRLIADDALRGMTSNPTLFEKAIAETDLYDARIHVLRAEGRSGAAIAEALALEDVRGAADVFRPVFNCTRGIDGFVSIEVRPQLAHDTEGTVAEARRLWAACRRRNVMIKIPATDEGIPAIRRCLADGININITLLFSIARYRKVMDAYLEALEERIESNQPIDRLRSVASFFVSRVDAHVDPLLEAIAGDGGRSEHDRETARSLIGNVAIANARLAYLAFLDVFHSPRFEALHARGAALQRPLWASMSAKNPAYPALYYVRPLIAPASVATLRPDTFAAYRRDGRPRVRIHDDVDGAREVLRRVRDLHIDLDAVARELEEQGARKFVASWDALVSAIEERAALLHGHYATANR